jgi:hypothetical protein
MWWIPVGKDAKRRISAFPFAPLRLHAFALSSSSITAWIRLGRGGRSEKGALWKNEPISDCGPVRRLPLSNGLVFVNV